MVFDDIKDKLHPSIMKDIDKYDQTVRLLYKGKQKLTVNDMLRPFLPFEINNRCLKSIQYHHKKHDPH